MTRLRLTAIFSIILLCLTISVPSIGAPKKKSSRKLDKQLLEAVEAGDTEKVKSLLDQGANVETRTRKKNEDRRTVVAIAARSGNAQMVRLLLDAGAAVNAKDNYRSTPLIHAAVKGNSELVRMLLDSGAEVNAANKASLTPLMVAAVYGHIESVRLLLEAGAYVSRKDVNGDTALDLAKEEGYDAIVQLISHRDSQPGSVSSPLNLNVLKGPLPKVSGRRPAIAIPDLFALGLSPTEAGILSNKVRGFMTETGYFKVLSDPDMKSILNAQDFNVSDRCDDAMCLAEMGKILQVEKVIGGTVGKLGKRYSLSLRMVDVESGEIEHHVNRDIECPIEQLLEVVQLLSYELAKEYVEARTEPPPHQSMP